MEYKYGLTLTNDFGEVFEAKLIFSMKDCIAFDLRWEEAEEIPTELRDILAYQLIEAGMTDRTFGFTDNGDFTWEESDCSFEWSKIK